MPRLKYYDTETKVWKRIDVDGEGVQFSRGEYKGKTLLDVLRDLRSQIGGETVTKNTYEFHTIRILEDTQSVPLPTGMNPETDSFIVFLNAGALSEDAYSLNETNDSLLFNGPLYRNDELYLAVFKTIRIKAPEVFDGIVITEGSIQESKLVPALREKINSAIPTSEKGNFIATLEDGKVPLSQLPSMDYAPSNHTHENYALVTHTHDNKADVSALNAHTADTSLHTTANEKQTLQRVRYNEAMNCIEFVFPH